METKLYLGDCLEIMKDIPDNSVDAVVTDLPYGVLNTSNKSTKWDIVIPFEPMWEQMTRVAKDNAAIVLFAQEPFTSKLILSNAQMFRQKLTWLKTRPTNVFNAKKQFMNWTEDIVVFYKRLPTFNPQMRTDGVFTGAKVQRRNTDRSEGVFGCTGEKKDYVHESNGGLFYPKTVLEFSNVPTEKINHPTVKPTLLFEYLIKTYSNEGDTILDATMGSGTCGVACARTNRNFVGIELDENYYSIAKKRIEDAKSVLTLF